MRTLVVILLTLVSQVARADADDKATKIGYGAAWMIKAAACTTYSQYLDVYKPCESMVNKLKHGYPVNVGSYNAWCGPTVKFSNEIMKYRRDYKTVYGKEMGNLKDCKQE